MQTGAVMEFLKKLDSGLITLDSGDGTVMISNKLQGRIFAAFDGDIVHRLLKDLAASPDPEEFNNLGGNSLWPGPEGGDFAFNYPPAGSWYVQKGINSVPTVTEKADAAVAVVSKDIELVNRKGNTVKLRFRRTVRPLGKNELPAETGVKVTGYHSVDELIPLADYTMDEALFCAWSLEQFPGAEGITGFGRCAGVAVGCANSDFYGDPGERLSFKDNLFRFDLGGPKRLQIGIKASFNPEMIGSLDRQRGILALRTTPPREDGRYINIADNDQPAGPFAAEDMFSIFNGSQELDFYELETISPMSVSKSGVLQAARLESTTVIAKGEVEKLEQLLELYGITL